MSVMGMFQQLRTRMSTKCEPSLAAGIETRLWSAEDLGALWESYEQRRAERAA